MKQCKATYTKHLNQFGFSIVNNIFTENEIHKILNYISKNNFEKKFGVRYFLKKNEALTSLIFTKSLKSLIQKISQKAFVVKSIYFDKPPNANWIVNWHQDLTINVTGSTDEKGYSKWRKTKDRIAVQPPLDILEEIFTIRIHLDDCTIKNGALRVIPKSHLEGVLDKQQLLNKIRQPEKICEVKKGGILLMKPLLLHASKRVENQMNRRVIHIEFSSKPLAKGLRWLEKLDLIGFKNL